MAFEAWTVFYRTNLELYMLVLGGPHSILASRPAALGSILGVPKIFSETISWKILDVVDISTVCTA